MKYVHYFTFILVLFSCSSGQFGKPGRVLASVNSNGWDTNDAGKYFGSVTYENHPKYKNEKRNVIFILKKIVGQNDSYYGLITQLIPKADIGLSFVAGGKTRPISKRKIPYLTELYDWVKIYKFEKIDGENKYRAIKMKVENGEICSNGVDSRTKLMLGSRYSEPESIKRDDITSTFRSPFANLVTAINGKDINIKFYTTKRFTAMPNNYQITTRWENDYVDGPYNPGYKQSEVINLKLFPFDKSRNEGVAEFNAKTLKGETIEGKFRVNQAIRGMYTFEASGPSKGAKVISDKIGIFHDVYDAEDIGMATVELALIDPEDPHGSLMFFEEYGNNSQN